VCNRISGSLSSIVSIGSSVSSGCCGSSWNSVSSGCCGSSECSVSSGCCGSSGSSECSGCCGSSGSSNSNDIIRVVSVSVQSYKWES
jgi:hypothetical protein